MSGSQLRQDNADRRRFALLREYAPQILDHKDNTTFVLYRLHADGSSDIPIPAGSVGVFEELIDLLGLATARPAKLRPIELEAARVIAFLIMARRSKRSPRPGQPWTIQFCWPLPNSRTKAQQLRRVAVGLGGPDVEFVPGQFSPVLPDARKVSQCTL